MPDYGRLTEEQLPHSLPAIAPLYPPPPWPLPGAEILKVAFETDKEAALRWLPPRLTRATPPYALITVARYRNSPVGPFALACQYIGCRAAMFIRAFTLQAVADSSEAVAGLRELWGYPCKPGEVSLDRHEGSIEASVSRMGRIFVRIQVSNVEPIEPSSVRLDPVLNVRVIPSLEEGKRHDAVRVAQIDPDYEITECARGRAEITYPDSSEEHPWSALPVLNVISATYCVANTEMPLARFVMPY